MKSCYSCGWSAEAWNYKTNSLMLWCENMKAFECGYPDNIIKNEYIAEDCLEYDDENWFK